MPAHNDSFPWMSYYGNYRFFEDRMGSHNKVSDVRNTGEGLYEIDLKDGRTLVAFICDCYSFGLAEYQESVERLGKLNAVVINSNWCNYTMDLKLHCQEKEVGVFDIGSFMAALNQQKFWEYLSEEEKERLQQDQGI
ncbi:hypothetical protein [Candidatus Spongiihabitans sp.]|uniref:hypothetical protein n=1 Tax=Candidatus Spongiihabitans sp. TaxID=3101308 RepID=UPI003C7AE899